MSIASKFREWKLEHDEFWFIFVVPFMIGAVAIPTIVAAVYAVMHTAFLKKALLIALGAVGIVFAVWFVGLVLFLLHEALSGLFDRTTGKEE